MRASRVDITLDARGKARVVDARGDVSLRSGSRHGHAEQLTLLPQRRRLELSGKARLVDKTLGAELAGARVALDLESGAVEVLDARASFGRPRQRRDR